MVPRLGPRIGKQDEGARDRALGQPVDQQPGVVAEHADVGEAVALDVAEQLDDAVHERLAADQADVGVAARLPGEVLAAAEADLQPNRAHLAGEQRRRRERGVQRPGVDVDAGQQAVDPLALGRAKAPAAPAPVQDAAALRHVVGSSQRRIVSSPPP